MKRQVAVIGVALLLAACGDGERPKAPSAEPIIAPLETKVPQAVECVPPNFAPPPEYPDTDAVLAAAPDAAERYKLLWVGRKLRNARLSETETVVKGCKR